MRDPLHPLHETERRERPADALVPSAGVSLEVDQPPPAGRPDGSKGFRVDGTARKIVLRKNPESFRQCTAMCRSRNVQGRGGQRCMRSAIKGGMVCWKHGGQLPSVQRKAKERLADLIDSDRVLRKLAALVYAELSDFLDDEGKLLPKKDWPKEFTGAVQAIKIGKDGTPINIRLVSQMRALEALMRYLGMWKEQVEVTSDAEIIAALEAGRQFAAAFKVAAEKRGLTDGSGKSSSLPVLAGRTT